MWLWSNVVLRECERGATGSNHGTTYIKMVKESNSSWQQRHILGEKCRPTKSCGSIHPIIFSTRRKTWLYCFDQTKRGQSHRKNKVLFYFHAACVDKKTTTVEISTNLLRTNVSDSFGLFSNSIFNWCFGSKWNRENRDGEGIERPIVYFAHTVEDEERRMKEKKISVIPW